jgi:hypothetical protein
LVDLGIPFLHHQMIHRVSDSLSESHRIGQVGENHEAAGNAPPAVLMSCCLMTVP